MRAFLLLAAPALALAQSPATPAEQRGRQIYERGASASGAAIEAVLPGDVKVPGAVLPCVNCHGADGRGRPEGGVAPSNISWAELTKPYSVSRAGGRITTPYNERLFKRAIAMGVDPSGNELNPAMPRFSLSNADAEDLLAYIKRLGQAVDTGVSAAGVRLGVILRNESQAAPESGILKRAVTGYFDRVNQAGGVFGRKIELEFLELPGDRAGVSAAALNFLRERGVFAAIGDFSEAGAELAATMRDARLPCIAAFAPFPELGRPLNPEVFYLDGGLAGELEALADFSVHHFPGQDLSIAISGAERGLSVESAAWLRARLAQMGRKAEEGDRPADLVFWLGPGAPPPSGNIPRAKAVFVAASLLGDSFKMPADIGPPVFMAAGAGAHEPGPQLAWERSTASAAALTSALRTAGRNLTRAGVIAALEDFRGVETGFPAPLTFGISRRVGAIPALVTPAEGARVNLIPAAERKDIK